MIEITGARGHKDEHEKISKKGKLGTVRKGNRSFSSELHRTLAQEFEGSVDELLDSLRDQEKRFLDSQSEYEMNRYKALLQKIMKMLLDDGLREKVIKRKKKNWGDFVIIEKINARLQDITDAITRQNKAFNLLKTMDEIRGLVMDLIS